MPQDHQEERRRKVLTRQDVEVLRDELRALLNEHKCQFSPEEIQVMRDFVTIYKETRSTILKLAIGAFFFLMLVLIVLGINHRLITPER